MAQQHSFPLIRSPRALPPGTPEFEAKRNNLLNTFYSKIPAEYRLPQSLLDNPPVNVTDIPRTCGILSPEELQITEDYDAVGLAEAIATKRLTAVAVATAFSKRAIIAHQLSCCLTQWCMDDALVRAKYLDDYLERNGKVIGPLHGVPISIKAHLPVAGTWSSGGYMSDIQEDDDDCQITRTLRSLGAVFYCKTHQPQAIMHLESASFWGRTLNPHNINLSSGGSSGGESALLALRGSVLGVGTDVGGSIRGPAGFCGIYGFKPTTYTLPIQGFLPQKVHSELNIPLSTGPMCHTARDMDFFMRSVQSVKPYLEDTRLIPIPWTGLGTKIGALNGEKRLKIGIMMNDSIIQPQPPVTRALEWARQRLAAQPDLFDVKPYHPYQPETAYKRIRKYYWPDGALGVKKALKSSGEPMHPLSRWIIRDGESDTERTASELITYRVERNEFRSSFAKNWNSQDVDVVLCPVFVGPACAHDTAFHWNYTYLWNFVDYPGIVFPTPIKAECGEQYAAGNETPLSDDCSHVRRLWTETDFTGAPIGLQLVARRHHDNELFGSFSMLQHTLNLP